MAFSKFADLLRRTGGVARKTCRGPEPRQACRGGAATAGEGAKRRSSPKGGVRFLAPAARCG